jgi:hypothetical protein
MRGEFECLLLLRKSEPQNIEQGISIVIKRLREDFDNA